MTSPSSPPERQNFSIVLLGAFNPAIFQPLWFSVNGLVPKEEAEAAELQVVHKDLSSLTIGSIQIQINKQRFGITALESSQGPQVRDLALGVICILEHTPLTAIGLNLEFLFGFNDDASWHGFGHRLAPKEAWRKFLIDPGMSGLEIEGKRDGVPKAKVNMRVAPSADIPRGVQIAINQHYDLKTPALQSESERNAEASRILAEDWAPFCSYARHAANSLLDRDSESNGGNATC